MESRDEEGALWPNKATTGDRKRRCGRPEIEDGSEACRGALTRYCPLNWIGDEDITKRSGGCKGGQNKRENGGGLKYGNQILAQEVYVQGGRVMLFPNWLMPI